ncbi:MAG TPA: ABC transporter substrate-binding protein [Devosia sp.]|nr:ABC transporter substrate-binding protein [Devosia sp.]
MHSQISLIAAAAMALALMAPASAQEAFDLDALATAAKAEAPITVYAVTGKIVETAEAFTAKYGVEATGKKVNEADQIELLIRESQSGNIVGDVSVAADVASIVGQLIPSKILENWVPPDVEADIAEANRDPLVLVTDPQVWTYNTEVYDTCPVTNVWQLTEPEWARKVTMLDPLVKPAYADWFNQLETHHDAEMAAAYEALYGKKLETTEKSATAAWVKAYAQNQPLLADSSGVSEAIGAPGQTEPYFGITSTAKYRDNEAKGFKLGVCQNMAPFSGFLYPGYGMIATGTKSPNAARLFIHYLLTEEGIAPQTVDGKISTNKAIPTNPAEASGITTMLDQLLDYDSSTAAADFDLRQDWQDFWRVNYSR